MPVTPSVHTVTPVHDVGLVLRPNRDLEAILGRVQSWAAAHDIVLHGTLGDSRLPQSVTLHPEQKLAEACDAVVSLGGDGTMLGALRLAAPANVPVLGINLGTLGYLTELDADHLELGLRALGAGSYGIESRTSVAMRSIRGAGVTATAYNDVVLSRVPGRGLAKLGLRVDGELLVRYSSDGLIVATPQGSTAYSFAAGGPLISPQSRAIVLTPDAAHGLFNRAVVLTEHEHLEVDVLASSAPVSLEIDGQLIETVDPGATLDFVARPDAAKVIRVRTTGFADQARRKLGIADPAGLADFDAAGHTRP